MSYNGGVIGVDAVVVVSAVAIDVAVTVVINFRTF